MADAEVTAPKQTHDDLAGVVLDRYRRAKMYREQHIVHQGKSFQSLLDRAEKQYRREYTTQDAADMEESFGFCPSRYYGLVAQKVNASVAWYSDLVINNLDSMFVVSPTPEPELDKQTLNFIRAQVRDELRRRMADSGIVDANLLLDARGQVQRRVEGFLREQVRALKQVEQSRIVSAAAQSAKVIQRRMRDRLIEGNFRQAYMPFTFERMLHGNSIMRFPDWRRRPVLKHVGKRAQQRWDTVPWFRHVRLKDFFPIADAIDYQTNTGNTEYTYVTKAELIGMARQENYFESEITKILEEFAYRTRNWIDGDNLDDQFWQLDDTIPVLIHEGYFSGDELREYGINGLDTLDYVSARIEVCGGRTIRCQLLKMPGGADRSYFGAPFNKVGDNLYDTIGMGAMLWDSEQRVNRIMHLFEHNMDWSSRPPLMSNPSVFENPADASRIHPGRHYNVEDRFATSGSMPEPIRPMAMVSAQYHLIFTQVGGILRQADEECGVPAFAYGAQDFGRSSLGEYSQRMSNALRTIKQAALIEDINFIEPTFESLFAYELETDPDLASGQDVGAQVRGMTGLLQEDQRNNRQQAVIGAVFQGAQTGIYPEPVVRYAARKLLEQAGFPVDALGMSDPEMDNALAIAAQQAVPGASAGGPQVPALDGRSGVPAANVAAPSGASQLSVPGVQL
jgi:hypothetical protein